MMICFLLKPRIEEVEFSYQQVAQTAMGNKIQRGGHLQAREGLQEIKFAATLNLDL